MVWWTACDIAQFVCVYFYYILWFAVFVALSHKHNIVNKINHTLYLHEIFLSLNTIMFPYHFEYVPLSTMYHGGREGGG